MSTSEGEPESSRNRTVWQRVAGYTRARRLELGMTQQEAAEQAGLSLATWRLVESAGRDRYQELTQHGVCRALGWRHDAFDMLTASDAEGIDPAALLAPRSDPADLGGSDAVPSGLSRSWAELTPQERMMVQGYMDGLLASRRR